MYYIILVLLGYEIGTVVLLEGKFHQLDLDFCNVDEYQHDYKHTKTTTQIAFISLGRSQPKQGRGLILRKVWKNEREKLDFSWFLG